MALEHAPAASCIRFHRTLSSTLGSSSVMDFGSRRGPFRPGVNEWPVHSHPAGTR